MDEAVRAIVELRVEWAREELAAANSLVRDGYYRIAASRAYYAAFLVTTGVLLTRDLVRVKHSGVQAALGENFINPGLIEDEFGRIYARLRRTRESSDYSDQVTVTEEIARERLTEAERFVERFTRYLREVGALPAVPPLDA